jgi:hypothetical protein
MHRGLTVTLFFCLLAGCAKLDRIKQVRTVADMQTIASKISAQGPSGRLLNDQEAIHALIRSVADGRDAWGNEYLYFTRASATGESYVLVSLGSDGKREYEPDTYFSLRETAIHGDAKRDIVFRDGHLVTLAGK